MGNSIWGMVVAVETEPGKLVAFTIPASDLKVATRQAAEAARNRGRPISDPTAERSVDSALDELGRDAVTVLWGRLKPLLEREPAFKKVVLHELGASTS
jgi:hypothetical protein